MFNLNQIQEIRELYTAIGEDNISDCKEDYNAMVRCDNLIKRVENKPVFEPENQLVIDLMNGQKISLGSW